MTSGVLTRFQISNLDKTIKEDSDRYSLQSDNISRKSLEDRWILEKVTDINLDETFIEDSDGCSL